MKKYEVGYDGELIGVYYAFSKEDAIRQCKADMSWFHFKPDTPARDRLLGMIANEVK
jgi:hypothetical protein